MKKHAIIIGLLLIAPFSFGQNLSEELTDGLKRAKMTFTMPEDYTEVERIENPHMLYDYALKHNKEKFEVRYCIHPMDEMLADYDERIKNKKEGDIIIHPDSLYDSIAMAVGFNISSKGMVDMGPFDPGAVKAEFNADKGLTSSMIDVRKEFGGEYRHCIMVSIHKYGLGTAFYFYMFDDPNLLRVLMMPVFYGLKFE